MSNIYHYCSLETFMKIVEKKTIRLSDLNKTNDYLEKKWGIDYLQKALEDILHTNGIHLNLQEAYWYSDEANNHLDELRKAVDSALKHQTLIACFSLSKDRLSQWRAYGQDGAGVAVGFNEDLLKKLLENRSDIFFGKVAYQSDEQKQMIGEKVFRPGIDEMRKLCGDLPRIAGDFGTYFINEFDGFCERLRPYIRQTFPFLKNPAFEEEEEVRIVYNTDIGENTHVDMLRDILTTPIAIGEKHELILEPIKHQVKGDKLVAYADLCFKNCLDLNIIGEIVIGPKARAKVTEADIRQVLLENGFDGKIEIEESVASYQ